MIPLTINLFVDTKLAELYQCELCHNVARNPYNLCHKFCAECIDTYMIDDTHCPAACSCDLSADQPFQPNKALINDISNLQVRCGCYGDGCEWSGKLGENASNLTTHMSQCEYHTTTCKQCNESAVRNTLNAGYCNTCYPLTTSCQICHAHVITSKLIQHYTDAVLQHMDIFIAERQKLHELQSTVAEQAQQIATLHSNQDELLLLRDVVTKQGKQITVLSDTVGELENEYHERCEYVDECLDKVNTDAIYIHAVNVDLNNNSLNNSLLKEPLFFKISAPYESDSIKSYISRHYSIGNKRSIVLCTPLNKLITSTYCWTQFNDTPGITLSIHYKMVDCVKIPVKQSNVGQLMELNVYPDETIADILKTITANPEVKIKSPVLTLGFRNHPNNPETITEPTVTQTMTDVQLIKQFQGSIVSPTFYIR